MLTLIYNATIVNEGKSFRGSVLIEGERISCIIPGTDYSAALVSSDDKLVNKVDAHGCFLLPGFIDDQVHFRQPGDAQKGTIENESKAALLGGITTFLDMPNNQPPITDSAALQQKYALAKTHSYANYGFYMGATNSNTDQVLQTHPLCCGLKIFMGSSTGNMLVDNPKTLETLFAQYKGVIATHCESEPIIRQNLLDAKNKYSDNIPVSMHSRIRSRQACIASTTKALELAVKYGTRLHILHLSTAQELKLVREAKKANPLISAEACMPHLLFSQKDYSTYGTAIKCNPAIKLAKDRDALRAAVRSGLIDAIGSDHAPHTWAQKQNPYLNAPSGIPMVQHSLPALLEMVSNHIFTIEQIVQRMCHAPARIFHIPERGYIREGYYADLVLVDSHKPFTVTKKNIAYTCGWSPFEGHSFPWTINKVFVNGQEVVDNGSIIAKPLTHEVL